MAAPYPVKLGVTTVIVGRLADRVAEDHPQGSPVSTLPLVCYLLWEVEGQGLLVARRPRPGHHPVPGPVVPGAGPGRSRYRARAGPGPGPGDARTRATPQRRVPSPYPPPTGADGRLGEN